MIKGLKIKIKYIIVFLYLFNNITLFGQYDKEFWFAAPAIVPRYSTTLNKPVYLRLESKDKQAEVKISQPSNPGFITISVTIPKESLYSLDLSNYVEEIECKPYNTVLNKGIHIESTEEIFVFYDIVSSPGDPETYSLKGSYGLGKYFITPGQNIYSNHSDYSPTPYDRFYIIASEDNTTVTIIPSQNILGHNAKQSFDVKLNKGQVYVASATNQNAQNHLRGSEVKSDKPVAITICDDLISKDYCQNQVGDQILPVSNWGTEYAIVKGDLNSGDFIILTGSVDNTEIYLDDSKTPFKINKNEFKKLDLQTSQMYIKSDNPINAMHYSGLTCEVGVSTLLPTTCGGGINNFQYSFIKTQYDNNSGILLITVPKGHENDFQLNNKDVFIKFTPFKGNPELMSGKYYITNYSYYTNFKLSNTSSNFTIGFLQGKTMGGSYSYFSNFGTIDPQKNILSGMKDIDFGEIRIGCKKTELLKLENNGKREMQIMSISVKNYPKVFQITTNPILPAKIPAGGYIEINIDFYPNEILNYKDIITLQTDNICYTNLNSNLKGNVVTSRLVYLPDTVAEVGQKDFCIPLMINESNDSVYFENLSFSATISFDASMYSSTFPEVGYVSSGKRFITITGEKITLTNKSQQIGKMCGLVLLSENNKTPLTLEDITWSEPKLIINKYDGSLSTIGVCARPIRYIQLINPLSLDIYPNPSNDKLQLTLKSLELGPVYISLYSYDGSKIYNLEFINNNSNIDKMITINTTEFSTGIYTIRIINNYKIINDKVVILK